MMPGRRVTALLFFLGVGACHGGGRDATAPPPPQLGWRAIATPADRARLRTWRDAWTNALAKVAKAGMTSQVTAQDALMQPDAALRDARPPAGTYRCRTFKLGAKRPGGHEYVAYPPATCRITLEHDLLSFTKLDGPQRPVGLLFPDEDAPRMIFLGTMMLGDETRALDYGRDPERDIAGALERVGPRQWRLVLPYPNWESTLDVIELTPLG